MSEPRYVGPAPKCTNGTRRYPCYCRGRRYTCPGCLRFVPWCYGAADDAPELCDECWAAGRRETP